MNKFRVMLMAVLVMSAMNVFSQITLTPYCTGLSAPCDIRHCGDSRLFVVEQSGRIRIIDSTGLLVTQPFLNITDRVLSGGERGLLGLAFPSDYLSEGWFYVNYTSRPSGHTRISRFRVNASNPNQADSSSEEVLLTIYQPFSNHNGGCLAFSPENGYLYIGMGDGGSGGDPGNRSQNPDSLLGKMLRIAVQSGIPGYSIPPGNPFASDTTLGRPEIWAIGVRNPWRFSFDRMSGDLWMGDVGQNVLEEINFEPAGTEQGPNYGWRCYEGTQPYITTGCLPSSTYTGPVWEYAHTGGNCSVTGGYVYRGAKYADMFGKYFFADYCVDDIRTLERNGSNFTHTSLGILATGSFVTFGEDRWGELYLGDASGRILRFSSSACNPVAAINGGLDTVATCGPGQVLLRTPAGKDFQYSWTVGGVALGHNYDTLSVNSDSEVIVTVTDSAGCSATDTSYVLFRSLPVVSFSGLDTSYCDYDAAETLLPVPIGGTFTGVGISGVRFDPQVAGVGTHVITYTYTDSNGCTASDSQSTQVVVCTSVPEQAALTQMNVYPNPASDKFIIGFTAPKNGSVELDVYDLAGKRIEHDEFNVTSGAVEHEVSSSGWNSGVYMLKIRYGGFESHQRVTIR